MYPIYTSLAHAPMLSDGEIWRPLPDEGYMPDTMGWDEVGREKNKPSERGAMRWIVGRKGEVHGHDNDLCFLSRR